MQAPGPFITSKEKIWRDRGNHMAKPSIRVEAPTTTACQRGTFSDMTIFK